MNTVNDKHACTGFKSEARLRGVLGLVVGLPIVLLAVPPRDPLPPPLYSFHLDSVSVRAGHVVADGILVINDPYPIAITLGLELGLGLPGDDLDSLSGDNRDLGEADMFVLTFSVDELTTGTVPPDEEFIEDDVGYNVRDQWFRGHQAGDLFMSGVLFNRDGAVGRRNEQIFNNVLVRNNYDEGGTDYFARPETSAEDIVPMGPQDRVNATARDLGGPVFFTVSAGSPSLWFGLPSSRPSGANIFCYTRGEVFAYAEYSELGLGSGDDIDGLVVLDSDADGMFDGSDQIFFSLSPGSPSLGSFPDGSDAPAADVLSVRPGESPTVFATSIMLGLGDPMDNIDALDILPCEEVEDCAEDHGIRTPDREDPEEEEEEEEEEDRFGSIRD